MSAVGAAAAAHFLDAMDAMDAMADMNENPLDILPEILLLGSAVLGLLLGSFTPRTKQWLVGLLAAAACAAGIVAAAVQAGDPAATSFGGAYGVDPVTSTARIVILGGTLIVLALTSAPVRGHPREAEFYVLLQLTALGSLALAGAQDLLLLAAAYLLAGIPAYALTAFRKDGPGLEGALKYYVVGALLGVVMLGGITVLYAAGRATAYMSLHTSLAGAPRALVAVGAVGLLAGVLFKAGAVPVHFWVPDAVQGAGPSVAAALTTLPKIGAMAALLRLGAVVFPESPLPWAPLIAVLAAASMTLGNLAAFFQTDVQRLLGYSTISQVGYLLLPVAVAARADQAQQALLFYLAGYALTNLGAFAVVCALPRAREPADYRGLARRRPLLAASLVVCLLGLVGTPPTAVFLGKLEVFSAAVDGGYAWLAALAAANTVASLFYYLRWIVPAVSRGGDDRPRGTGDQPCGSGDQPCGRFDGDRAVRTVAYAIAAATLALGVAAGPVLGILDGALAG